MRRNYMIFLAIAATASFPLPATAGLLTSAERLAELGGSTVANTGSTTIIGDVGHYPGPSIVGFAIPPANTVVEGPGSTGLVNGPELVDGTIYISHAVAQQTQLDNTTVYNGLAAMPYTSNLTGMDLGGLVLTSGVYHFDSTTKLRGSLPLDTPGPQQAEERPVPPADSMEELALGAQGLNHADGVFQTGSSDMTTSDSAVTMIPVGSNNSADDRHFWRDGSSSALDTSNVLEGHLLTPESIILESEATNYDGLFLAQTGPVTMDTNAITSPIPYMGTIYGGPEFDEEDNIVLFGASAAAVAPEPGSFLIFSSGLIGLLGFRKRIVASVT